MVSLSLYAQFETNLMSNRKVIKLLLQLKSTKAHGINYIKVRPSLIRHRLRNRLFHGLQSPIRLLRVSHGVIKSLIFFNMVQPIDLYFLHNDRND